MAQDTAAQERQRRVAHARGPGGRCGKRWPLLSPADASFCASPPSIFLSTCTVTRVVGGRLKSAPPDEPLKTWPGPPQEPALWFTTGRRHWEQEATGTVPSEERCRFRRRSSPVAGVSGALTCLGHTPAPGQAAAPGVQAVSALPQGLGATLQSSRSSGGLCLTAHDSPGRVGSSH